MYGNPSSAISPPKVQPNPNIAPPSPHTL